MSPIRELGDTEEVISGEQIARGVLVWIDDGWEEEAGIKGVV